MIDEWRKLPRWSRTSGVAGAIALVACAFGAIANRGAFAQGWLVAWLFLLGLALASMVLLMIHELTGGGWGVVLRPVLEAAMSTLPLVALFAAPLALTLPDVFPWAANDVNDAVIEAKRWFLNTPAFLARNILLLVVWSALALAMRRHLARGDASKAIRRRIAIAGLIVYLPTITIAAFDWIASLAPQWYSTAIGLRLAVAQLLAGFAFAVVFAALGARADRHRAFASPHDCHDLGNLLLTFAMTWGYIVFMQYLIVWGEDLPHETTWFWPRVATSWQSLAIPLVMLNCIVPTIAMLFRAVKRNAARLAVVCVGALIGQWLDTFWLVAPSLRTAGLELHVLDALPLVAQGGLWLALIAVLLERRPASHATERKAAVYG